MKLFLGIMFVLAIFLATCAVLFMMGFGASRLAPVTDTKRRNAGNLLFGLSLTLLVISTAILTFTGVPQ